MAYYTAPVYTEADLELLDESDLHYPYSDERAVYIGRDHQYELTPQYFAERGVTLAERVPGNEPDKVAHFLKDLRVKVYTFVYTHTALSGVPVINYLIAKRGLNTIPVDEYRRIFLEAMYLEGVYLLVNGDVSNTSGIDLDTMQNMSAEVIRNQNRDFNKDAIGLLKTLGLCYYGRYNFIPQGEDW